MDCFHTKIHSRLSPEDLFGERVSSVYFRGETTESNEPNFKIVDRAVVHSDIPFKGTTKRDDGDDWLYAMI